MMPDECASIRSIARWVFPVLVGPSTAVTPAPRARKSRSVAGENEIGIKIPAWTQAYTTLKHTHLYHNVTLERPVLKVWNESGTNRGRIGDSTPVRIRSPRYMVRQAVLNTRSGEIVVFGRSRQAKSINGPNDNNFTRSQGSYLCG